MASAAAEDVAMNAREAQVYDRQIRLWGVEAQKRLRSSHVLISGLNGVNAEVRRRCQRCPKAVFV